MPEITKSLNQSFPLWRYFFWDIPLWAIGWRSQHRWLRIQSALSKDAIMLKNSLQAFYADRKNPVDIDNAVKQALLIRTIRNSDAYACLGINKRNLYKNFSISGLEHLRSRLGQDRPVFLLTAHIGSFYTISIALAQLGIRINPVARTVDDSQYNPLPQQLFEHSNYWLTQIKMPGQYIYTNNTRRMDRRIVSACKENKILLVLLDLPRKFIPANRHPVQFLGKKSSFPIRLIDLGVKYNAIFLTLWSTIETKPDFSFKRRLTIDPVIQTTDRKKIIQSYADRLSSIAYQEPWQWLGSMIINQYNEETT
ncbi:MAG: hypothetical protein H6936_07475 [Burkholderiales bacterium]|nr:hypothetical protein [Nitrosomonas sp.]MCP5274680.1 hypothetical protein [Burkholderiales bacterium]